MNENNDFEKTIHAILAETVKMSSLRHTVGATEEQKHAIEAELDKITESCRVLKNITGGKR